MPSPSSDVLSAGPGCPRVGSLLRDAQPFPARNRVEIRRAIVEYADSVATDEWDRLPEVGANDPTSELSRTVWNRYYDFVLPGAAALLG